MEFTATCHTEGCENADHAIPCYHDENDVPLNAVFCGVCGQEITDLDGVTVVGLEAT